MNIRKLHREMRREDRALRYRMVALAGGGKGEVQRRLKQIDAIGRKKLLTRWADPVAPRGWDHVETAPGEAQ